MPWGGECDSGTGSGASRRGGHGVGWTRVGRAASAGGVRPPDDARAAHSAEWARDGKDTARANAWKQRIMCYFLPIVCCLPRHEKVA